MRNYELLEFITILAIIPAFLVAIFLGLFGIETYTCHRYGRMTNHEVRVAFPAACYVKTDKGWFTYEQIRNY